MGRLFPDDADEETKRRIWEEYKAGHRGSQGEPFSPKPSDSTGGTPVLGIIAVCLGAVSLFVPYFAAVFLAPAALICGIIAFLKQQKPLGAIAIIASLVSFGWIFFVSHQITAIMKDPFGHHSILESRGSVVVSLPQYDLLQEGMSYHEAKGIIGSEGQEQSRSSIGDITTVIYVWQNPNGSNMNAMFQNDKLVTKAQFGLR